MSTKNDINTIAEVKASPNLTPKLVNIHTKP